MKKTLAALVALFLTSLALPARSEIDPGRGKHIIDEAVKALGGDKFLSMQDRVESGKSYSIDGQRFSGPMPTKIYTLYLDGPQPSDSSHLSIRERQAFGKGEYRTLLFSDGAGYEITFRGAQPVSNDVLLRHRNNTLTNIFYILRKRLGEPDLSFDFRGTTVRDNQIVEAVDIRDADGRNITVYFHHATKLPVRQVFHRWDPEAKERVEEVTLFSRFQDVGSGVMWPFRIERERDGQRLFEMSLDAVSVNQDLPEDLFVLSTKTKLLKPFKQWVPAG